MKRTYVLPILAILAAFLVPSEVVGKDWKYVTIGTEAAYPPFNMRTREGQLIGFDIDLGNDLCTRMKVSCEFVPQDFSALIGALTAGKFDAIMSGMSITPKRMEIISFSVPYVISPSVFAVRKNGPLADLPDEGARISLDDKDAFAAEIAKLAPQLQGKTAGVESATTHAEMLATYFKDIVTIRTYSQSGDRDLDLQTGRIDAALELVAHFAPTLAERGSNELKFAGPLFVGGVLGRGTAIGLRQSDADLKAKFDTAIKAAIADGTVRKLSVQWFKTDISPAQ